MADTLTLKEVELDYEADEGRTPPPPSFPSPPQPSPLAREGV